MASITCEPKQLADTLAAVKPAASTRSAIQALSGVLISANGDGVTLSTTDLDLAIRRAMPAAHDGELNVVLPLNLLAKAAKAFGKQPAITLTPTEESSVIVAGGHRKIELRTLRIEDFPEFPNRGGFTVASEVAGGTLADAIERVAKFASTDETRPVLTGVFVGEQNGELEFVATDSYRLCIRRLNGVQGWAGGYNVPARGLLVAAKLMRKAGENVEFRAYGQGSNGHAVIEFPGTTISMKLIDGQFPNYRQLIPDDFPSSITVPLAELRGATDVARQFILKNAPVRLWVNGHVKLHGHTPDIGSFEEILPGANPMLGSVQGEPVPEEFEIGFNAEFLNEAAQALNGETVRINLISPLRPALIHAEDDDAERHLLMPIRLNV